MFHEALANYVYEHIGFVATLAGVCGFLVNEMWNARLLLKEIAAAFARGLEIGEQRGYERGLREKGL